MLAYPITICILISIAIMYAEMGNVRVILRPASVVHIRNRLKSWPLFYDVLHAKCFSYAVLIEDMS